MTGMGQGRARGCAVPSAVGSAALTYFSLAGRLFSVAECAMLKCFMSAMLPVVGMAALSVPAAAAEWMSDFEAASQRAAAEDKLLLVDFTGSDWCAFCIQLRRQVLDTPGFESYAKDRFVLMEVDLPNSSKFDSTLRARNEALCRAYGIRIFPTVLVLTPRGEVAGGFMGMRPDLAAVQEELEPALVNARSLRQASELEGAARLDALMRCYEALPPHLRDCAKGLRSDIVDLDPQDVCGLREVVLCERQMDEIHRRLGAAGGDLRAERDVLADALSEALPGNRLTVLNMLYPLQIRAADSLDDLEQARQTMQEILDCNPPYAATIRKLLDTRFADPEALLRQVQEQRRLRAGG